MRKGKLSFSLLPPPFPLVNLIPCPGVEGERKSSGESSILMQSPVDANSAIPAVLILPFSTAHQELLSNMSSSFPATKVNGCKPSTPGTLLSLPSRLTGLSSWSTQPGAMPQPTLSTLPSRVALKSHRTCCFKSDVRFPYFCIPSISFNSTIKMNKIIIRRPGQPFSPHERPEPPEQAA